jgi:hypothetical protein
VRAVGSAAARGAGRMGSRLGIGVEVGRRALRAKALCSDSTAGEWERQSRL